MYLAGYEVLIQEVGIFNTINVILALVQYVLN